MAGVESLMADSEAHRINPSDFVRVTGVVTDDDGERGIAFLADGKRAIAVHTGPAGLNVPAGRRITLEAHLDSSATPSLVSVRTVAITVSCFITVLSRFETVDR